MGVFDLGWLDLDGGLGHLHTETNFIASGSYAQGGTCFLFSKHLAKHKV